MNIYNRLNTISALDSHTACFSMCPKLHVPTSLVEFSIVKRANMISYVCLIGILNATVIDKKDRNLEIVQLDIFNIEQGGVLKKK